MSPQTLEGKITKEKIRHAIKTYPSQYPTPKYLLFIQRALEANFRVYLIRAKTTHSKYVHVRFKNKVYKVRFSDHKPNYSSEEQESCNFFVGVTNLTVTTTEDAWKAMNKYFGLDVKP